MSKIAFFDTRSYDKEAFTKENEKFGYEIDFFDFSQVAKIFAINTKENNSYQKIY